MARATLLKTLETAIARAARRHRQVGTVLFSVDRFKLIISRFGHREADALLNRVAAVAKGVLGEHGKMGAWGGDEFLCILPDADATTSLRIAEEMCRAVEQIIIPISTDITNVTASFGVACYPDDGHDVKYLLIAADEALHHAKSTGRNRVGLARDLPARLLDMGSLLETALREDRVMAAYQPIVDLETGQVVAEEALARIITAEGDVIAAEDFIDVASQFQLIHKIDRAIVLSAFNRCASGYRPWPDKPITQFINISADLLRHPQVLKELLLFARTHCDQGADETKPLVIEVTERELLANLEATRRTLAPFLEFGLRLALDDFGSGYSSFQYLADLPVSFLKIDGGLIRRVHEPKVRALVRGIQNIASELNLTTLAEFVETERQVDILRDTGIDWAQGHHYGQAVLNEEEARERRRMSVNWTRGYYCHKPL
jgi:diguanylate cyclase (GGDEF)-like protein